MEKRTDKSLPVIAISSEKELLEVRDAITNRVPFDSEGETVFNLHLRIARLADQIAQLEKKLIPNLEKLANPMLTVGTQALKGQEPELATFEPEDGLASLDDLWITLGMNDGGLLRAAVRFKKSDVPLTTNVDFAYMSSGRYDEGKTVYLYAKHTLHFGPVKEDEDDNGVIESKAAEKEQG